MKARASRNPFCAWRKSVTGKSRMSLLWAKFQRLEKALAFPYVDSMINRSYGRKLGV
jgi:hypothetical protein